MVLLARRVYIITLIGGVLSVGMFSLLYYLKFAYWFYYLDTIAIAIVYIFGSCASGYLACDVELDRRYAIQCCCLIIYKFIRAKLKAAVVFLGTGLIVTGMTMVYGMFVLMGYGLLSTGEKMVWRLSVHPIFFELLVMVKAP
jgi:hypothetical protein